MAEVICWPTAFPCIGLSSSEGHYEHLHMFPEMITSIHGIHDGHLAIARCCSDVREDSRVQRWLSRMADVIDTNYRG